LHLIRRMADCVEYDYTKETRQSRITLRITESGLAARRNAATTGGKNARD
jgi:hypothetical protein